MLLLDGLQLSLTARSLLTACSHATAHATAHTVHAAPRWPSAVTYSALPTHRLLSRDRSRDCSHCPCCSSMAFSCHLQRAPYSPLALTRPLTRLLTLSMLLLDGLQLSLTARSLLT